MTRPEEHLRINNSYVECHLLLDECYLIFPYMPTGDMTKHMALERDGYTNKRTYMPNRSNIPIIK